ncbi:GDP-mannose 4,6-dehydratase [Methanobrevibacter sp. 87.7]|uniref:NAD-dependent epimerase/dehydratase family protein n=1 Tax=Methanobrevibacter sp. 87.7 TaxID=387957 RepID=UPI000B505747|nr:NAD-dependent epimerase/dehydratase family protein [Methanobrevibacter sp. 87.7]OWT32648.1 GDP-mannose 4,6-dehydratase [Methanobrevibacter sp. 87.7]
MEGKNIVVTGGLGFIGSHIVDELMASNNVTIIDNLSSGKVENLENPDNDNITLIQGDLNELDLDEILKGKDYVFHLAALASVPESVEKPLYSNYNNLDATLKLLNACKNNNIKKIIFSSSAAIYGENPNIPLKESEPYMPSSPYAVQKAASELYLKSFHESYGLNSVTLRYFNVFGPKQNLNSSYAAVIPNFISALLTGKQPVIYGDGEQTRDFIYVKDIVRANILACESDYNGIVNIASGKGLSVNELYPIIKEVLSSDVEPKYLEERLGDIKHSVADISNQSNINFKVDSSKFKDQLKETIRWFRDNL